MDVFLRTFVPPMGGLALCFLDVSTRFEQSCRAVGRSVWGVVNWPCGTAFGDSNSSIVICLPAVVGSVGPADLEGVPGNGNGLAIEEVFDRSRMLSHLVPNPAGLGNGVYWSVAEEIVLTTAATLRSQTVKDLGKLAKDLGLSGWSSMRKDDLIRALVRAARAKAKAKSSNKASSAKARAGAKASRSASSSVKRNAVKRANAKRPKIKTAPAALRRLRRVNEQRRQTQDLSAAMPDGGKDAAGQPRKDRIVLLVRDPYWVQACWEVSRQGMERARAAMAEYWHTAKPVLRVYEVDQQSTTSTTEWVARDIEIHGGVNNWYIDVPDPPRSYRVDLGYLANNDRFFALARSNIVSTPHPGSSDTIDENWSDVAEDYERVFALSGGYDQQNAVGELRELFEERLRRPMGAHEMTRYGAGAERILNRERDFLFEVDAEMIIFGSTKPDAHVTLSGEPVKLRSDGTFTVRVSMPDRRQVLPVVASSSDGVEQRTIVLAVERNTKRMEPKIAETDG